MVGYVYKTTNLKNGKVYIGKHMSSVYDPSYLGSGHILLKAIRAYGKDNFSNEIIYEAESEKDLDAMEIVCISYYKLMYGSNCYNLANGGEGGNTLKYASDEKREEFVEKMTQINQERCKTEEFRQNTSRHVTLRYQNPEERDKQSVKIQIAWSDPELRAQQSKRTTEWHKTHKINRDYQSHKCYIIFQGHVEQFNSEKECMDYLRNTYNFVPSDLKKCNPYKAFHSRHSHMNGLIFGYGTFQRKSVTTNPDECKGVGLEIGTSSKCETTLESVEEIV